MIVTLNEMERTVQKALCGVGAPPGIDDEIGAAAAWLEARGLAALDGLLLAIESWERDPGASVLAPTPEPVIEAEGRSAVFAGPGLLGIAVTGASPYLEIRNLKDPQFLIPLACTLCTPDRHFFITWTVEGQSTGARIGFKSGVSLLGHWPRVSGALAETVVLSAPEKEGPDRLDDTLALTHAAADLDARYRDTLSKGLVVEEDLWLKIASHAHRILVPASAQSRTRGAGSLSSDNE